MLFVVLIYQCASVCVFLGLVCYGAGVVVCVVSV